MALSPYRSSAPQVGWLPFAIVGLLLGIALFCLTMTPRWRDIAHLFDPRCTIKGNISYSGERIYHVPGQHYYAATTVRWFRGERWFCSEAEAQAAGWRRARI